MREKRKKEESKSDNVEEEGKMFRNFDKLLEVGEKSCSANGESDAE